MLKVTVEIVPGGQTDQARIIGTLNISLREVGQGDVGQYSSVMSTDAKSPPPNPCVFIDHHQRDQGAFALVQKCLDAHLRPAYDVFSDVLGDDVAELPDEHDGPTCALCGNIDLMGCQYDYGHPNHYDGISEWRCSCGARTGRWTGKILAEGESERKFGC